MTTELLVQNRLNYGMPEPTTVATIRRKILNFPEATASSNGGNVLFILQTGNQLIHGPSSYLRIKLAAVGGAAGSNRILDNIAGLFRRVIVTASSGQEICRVEDFGLFMSKQARYHSSKNRYDNLRETCFLEKQVAPGQPHVYAIMPLSWIPIFDQDVLLPSQLMHGLRIQFDLEEPVIAFYSQAGGAGVTSFSVECALQLDCTTLAVQFRDAIDQISETTGLMLLHKEHHRTIVHPSSSTAQFLINKSCSKALYSMVVPRHTGEINNPLTNSFGSENYPFVSAQCQIGSVFYPTSPLTQEGAASEWGTKEPYYYIQNEVGRNFVNAVPYNTFYIGTNSVQSAVFYQSFMLDNDYMSGVLLNNSRGLLFDLKAHDNASRRLDTYLCHLRLLRIFRNNVVVRD